MKKKLVIINGSGGVGKDTFIDLCDKWVKTYRVSSVDKVKEAAKILGWNGQKMENDRKFLSDLKLLSTEYCDHSYEYIKQCVTNFIENEFESNVMFMHIREPREIQKVKEVFDCYTILITNNNVSKISSNMADDNVENFKYDFVICNDGSLDDLKQEAIDFLFKILPQD